MSTTLGHILWADDEIDLLRPHILFLEAKGYRVSTVTNGQDAVDSCRENNYDLIFLDENMPGISGLQALALIKEISPATPVIMITKSEEEDIMNQAIGAKIADYLIKPVNPNQILPAIKKNLHRKDIVTEVTQTGYQQNFGKIGMQINDSLTANDWVELYRRLVFWELELEESESSMNELLSMQKAEANSAFAKYVRKNYLNWIKSPEDRPLMSPDLFKHSVFPTLDNKEKLFFIVIDNLRYDQWKALEKELAGLFSVDEELYYSILPTATQYARNAIFSGLMPNKIAEMFPELWVDEDEEEGKNLNEAPLIQTHISRYRRKDTFSYTKINDAASGERLLAQIDRLMQNDLNVVVFNFIDILSHARTESKMIRELASTEAAYRSLALSWFRHSPLKELFKVLAERRCKVVLTTDHGSIRVNNAIKIVGTRELNSNLRYKLGRNMTYNPKQVFDVNKPAQAALPSPNVSTTYVFATGRDFFAYPNNYNHYASYYTDTFQHGGISLEEMIIPLVTLRPK